MTSFTRRFTRPLLVQVADHGTAFAEILATRAEHDPALAAHLISALSEMKAAFPLDCEGVADPFIPQK